MIKAVQEKNFEYKGFQCVIRLLPAAYRCGYIGIPENMNEEIKIDTDSIQCHSPIDYEENTLPDSDVDGFFWIGFNCGHACNGRDVSAAKRLFADNEEALKYIQHQEQRGLFDLYKEYPPVSLEKCVEECKSIVEQILEENSIANNTPDAPDYDEIIEDIQYEHDMKQKTDSITDSLEKAVFDCLNHGFTWREAETYFHRGIEKFRTEFPNNYAVKGYLSSYRESVRKSRCGNSIVVHKIKLPVFTPDDVVELMVKSFCKEHKIEHCISKRAASCAGKAFRNAKKYGCQSTDDMIEIEFQASDTEAAFIVKDYGKGFDFDAEIAQLRKYPEAHSNIGYLLSEETGPDTLNIFSQKGEGTEVYIGFSLKNGNEYPY